MNPANNEEPFNKYEGNLISDEDFVDKDEAFYAENENLVDNIEFFNNYEDLSNVENNNNDESLFELDFNTLTKVKQFT